MYRKSVQLGMRDWTQSENSTARLGRKITFYLPHPKSDKFVKSFLYQGQTEWNRLPLETQTITTAHLFKLKIKRDLLKLEIIQFSNGQSVIRQGISSPSH